MVLGVRQSGKTYIINEFCKNNYKNYIYVNLSERKDIINLYSSNLTPLEKYNPKYSIRISTEEFGYNPDTKIKSVPLYAVFLIK